MRAKLLPSKLTPLIAAMLLAACGKPAAPSATAANAADQVDVIDTSPDGARASDGNATDADRADSHAGRNVSGRR